MNPVNEAYLLALVERIAVALEVRAPIAPDRTPHAGLGGGDVEVPAVADTPDLDEPDFSPPPTAKKKKV